MLSLVHSHTYTCIHTKTYIVIVITIGVLNFFSSHFLPFFVCVLLNFALFAMHAPSFTTERSYNVLNDFAATIFAVRIHLCGGVVLLRLLLRDNARIIILFDTF